MSNDQQDACLIARTQDGDSGAFDALASRHAALAFRVALRLLGNPRDAREIARDALVAAWQEIPALPTDQSFPAWLRQIVTRRAMRR